MVKKAAKEDSCFKHSGSERMKTGWSLEKIAESIERVCFGCQVRGVEGWKEGSLKHIYGQQERI